MCYIFWTKNNIAIYKEEENVYIMRHSFGSLVVGDVEKAKLKINDEVFGVLYFMVWIVFRTSSYPDDRTSLLTLSIRVSYLLFFLYNLIFFFVNKITSSGMLIEI